MRDGASGREDNLWNEEESFLARCEARRNRGPEYRGGEKNRAVYPLYDVRGQTEKKKRFGSKLNRG